MTNPLTKMALKAADMLPYLEQQQAQIAATIEYLRAMLQQSGVAPNVIDVGSHSNGNGHHTEPYAKKPADIVARAQALFQTRRGRGRPPSPHGSKRAARRAASIAYLAHFDPVTPRPAPETPGRMAGPLVHAGYLRKVGGKGYVRTAKPYAAAKPQTSGRGIDVQAQRAHTAKLLAKLSPTEPRPLPKGYGILVSNGYVKAQGDGYVRTEKAYVVQ